MTKAIVDASRPPKQSASDQAAVEQRDKVTAADLAPPGPGSAPPKKRDREDLYSDNWQGDQFVGGGFWNELTVGGA